jgi:cytochrome b561
VHFLIYALLIANGIAGMVGWFASGDPIVLFGWDVRAAREAQPQLTRVCLVARASRLEAPRRGS